MKRVSRTHAPDPESRYCVALDLDGFLQTLAEEGRKDSSGRFTLDPVRARETLRKYQLAHPYAFVGALLAAAYHARVPSVILNISRSEFQLRWPARTLPEGDEFLQHLLRPDSPRYLQELALGLNAALALRPRRLAATSGSLQRVFTADGEQVTAHSPPLAGLEIQLSYPRSSQFRRRLSRVLPEEQHLRKYCVLAAPEVILNGQLLKPQRPSGHCLATAVLRGGPERFVEQMQAELPPCDVQLKLDGPGPHGGVLAIYHDTCEQVQLIVDGLTFTVPELGIPGAWGLIMVPQLRRDLSAFSLVQDEAYQAVVETLNDALQTLLEVLGEQAERLDRGGKQMAAHILVGLAHARSSQERWAEAQALYHQVVDACEGLNSYPLAYFEAAYSLFVLYRRKSDRTDYHCRRFFEQFAEKVKRRFGVTLSMPAFYSGMVVVCPDTTESVSSFCDLLGRVDRLLGEHRTVVFFHGLQRLLAALYEPFGGKPR